MKSILTNPPLAEPVTLAEAKAHLRIDHDAEDALVTALIAAARRHVEAMTGLALMSQGWSFFADDWPANGAFTLPLHPLIAVEELKMHGEEGDPAIVDPSHYYVDRWARPARLILRERSWARPARIANGIEIEATLGFGDAADDVPEDLREAILRLVAHWHERRGDEQSRPLGFDALVAPYRAVRL
jgi:uncharacterized phiE125 gp8 family phage protein